MTDEAPEIWYRYEGSVYENSRAHIGCQEYPVKRRTPHGVWLDVYGTEKFTLSDSIKRFAYPTKKETLASFVAHKSRQVRILAAQHDRAEILYAAGKAKFDAEDYENNASDPNLLHAGDLF